MPYQYVSNTKIHSYGGIDFRMTSVPSTGFTLTAPDMSSIVHVKSPIYDTLNSIWDINEFKNDRKPLHVGMVDDIWEFSATIYGDDDWGAEPGEYSILDMPLKRPGMMEYLIPRGYQQFLATLEKCIRHEHTINPYVKDYYAYLTVDQCYTGGHGYWWGRGSSKSKHVEYQRRPGIHVEGWQGDKVSPKTVTEHHYHVVNTHTTQFYPFGIDLAQYDVSRINVYEAMDLLAGPFVNSIWRPKAYEIVMTDCYTLRAEPKLPLNIHRTFFRLTYSKRRYDRTGNTWNPMLGTQWSTEEKPIPQGLIKPVLF